MIIKEQSLHWAGHTWRINNYRTLYWSVEKTLILSDLHLGKGAHFRKNGIAMPMQVHLKDLDLLAQLIEYYEPAQLLVVGDLIHAALNSEVSHFKVFLQRYPDLQLQLVKGNHDRLSDAVLYDLGIHSVVDHCTIGGVHFVHEENQQAGFTISGHIHPGISIRMPTQRNIRLPCFVVQPQRIILPAFSHFTGLDLLRTPPNARYYVCTDNDIFTL